jgi:hypothetical protein
MKKLTLVLPLFTVVMLHSCRDEAELQKKMEEMSDDMEDAADDVEDKWKMQHDMEDRNGF